MSSSARVRPLSILYVEDDRDLVLLVTQRLAQAGFLVDAASDGQEALDKFARGSYDLLAIDQTLPVLDGLGVLQTLASRGPLPPTVMVTGTGNEKVAVQTMKLGADDYVVKDTGGGWLDLLPSIIDRVLRQRRLVEEKKAADDALRQRERQLWHAQKLESLGVLAGGIAHDFNNILAGIMGYADLAMVRLPDADPARDDIAEIKKASQRAADLTQQMLAYSGKGQFVVEPLSLSRCVEDLGRMLEVSVAKRAILKFNLAPDLPAVQADASQINQVLMNLVINAAEAIEAPGVISVTTDAVPCQADDLAGLGFGQDLPGGLYVRLEVADTGCGMDRQTLAQIFDPFFTTKFAGRGLGLAALQGIVRGHRGAVRVESQPGRGTTFQVLLPACGSVPPPAPPPPQVDPGWRGKQTVLIVDDEELIRTLAGRMLRHLGLTTLAAADGSEALRLYRQHAGEIACVLLDLTMPHMSGEETFRRLREINPGARVVLCSGYSQDDATARFAGQGLAGFIQKPYQLDTLRAQLRGVLEHVAVGSAPVPSSARGTVLIVDDEELVRKSTQINFELAGFSVLAAADGEEGLRLFGQHQAQIVCVWLDLSMPKMSGEDTLRELRRIDQQVRVILASGYRAADVAERLAGQRVWRFHYKLDPLDPLIAQLRDALG